MPYLLSLSICLLIWHLASMSLRNGRLYMMDSIGIFVVIYPMSAVKECSTYSFSHISTYFFYLFLDVKIHSFTDLDDTCWPLGSSMAAEPFYQRTFVQAFKGQSSIVRSILHVTIAARMRSDITTHCCTKIDFQRSCRSHHHWNQNMHQSSLLVSCKPLRTLDQFHRSSKTHHNIITLYAWWSLTPSSRWLTDSWVGSFLIVSIITWDGCHSIHWILTIDWSLVITYSTIWLGYNITHYWQKMKRKKKQFLNCMHKCVKCVNMWCRSDFFTVC